MTDRIQIEQKLKIQTIRTGLFAGFQDYRKELGMFTKFLGWAAQRVVIASKRKQKSERWVCVRKINRFGSCWVWIITVTSREKCPRGGWRCKSQLCNSLVAFFKHSDIFLSWFSPALTSSMFACCVMKLIFFTGKLLISSALWVYAINNEKYSKVMQRSHGKRKKITCPMEMVMQLQN